MKPYLQIYLFFLIILLFSEDTSKIGPQMPEQKVATAPPSLVKIYIYNYIDIYNYIYEENNNYN